jgi:predicted RNA-binding protein (virulence factor B family)
MKIPSLTVNVGSMNRLRVVTKVRMGVYLDGKDLDEILLPTRYVPDGTEVGDFLDVFVCLDSEDRLVATTETPLGMAGELAYLEIVSVNQFGAFADWGLPKDLLIPFGEQREGVDKGRRYIVYIYFDKVSGRLVGSTKVHKFINPKSARFKAGSKVDLIIANPFELGYNVIINKQFVGVIYHNEIFQPVEEGQAIQGFIKQMRPDGKIDVELQKSGLSARESLTEAILSQLKEAGGFLPITDKSPPEEIYRRFKASKRAYKQAVGGLYKKRLVTIDDDGLRLN